MQLIGSVLDFRIGHWKFDESSGSVATDGVNGNNADWVPGSDAAPDWKTSGGRIGGAIEFPGKGNHRNYFVIAGFLAMNGTVYTQMACSPAPAAPPGDDRIFFRYSVETR